MRTTWLLVLTLLISVMAGAQQYSLNNGFTNGGQVTTCAGTFKDSNPRGPYGNNEAYSVTFRSTTGGGQAVQLSFDTLYLAAGDTLFIYDGNTLAAPLLVAIDKSVTAPFYVRATASNATGSLTCRFQSDNAFTGAGWSATLSCRPPCQRANVQVTTNPAPDADGYINICKGGEVTVSGSATYPQNNVFYHQTDNAAKFLWSFSNGKDTSGTFLRQVKRTFTQEGGTLVQLSLLDQNECYHFADKVVKIRTAVTPSFNIAPQPVCLADTMALVARPAFPKAVFTSLPVYSESQPLPDGVGKCYENALYITQFAPGQLLTNINDLEGILINMEHSWLGDFTIAITAPNGAKVFLKKSTGTTAGWDSFLGEPVDEPSLNSNLATVPGKGYDYLFSPNPRYGTMAQEKGKYVYTYTDNAGQTQHNHAYLPAGSYASEEPLANLVGTPLNGLWTIEVCDNFKEDNGYIFYWTLQFKPSVYPNTEVYSNTILLQQWLPAPGLVSTKDSIAYVSFTNAGSYAFRYQLTDNFGCTTDTSVQVTANPLPGKPTIGSGDTVILCAGSTVQLSVANPQNGVQYTWSNGAMGTSQLTVAAPGLYWVRGQNQFGCHQADSIVVVASQPANLSLGADTVFCASAPLTLHPTISGSFNAFAWNTGATGQSLPVPAAGTYWLTGTTSQGCRLADTIVVNNNPINIVGLPSDTAICAGNSFTYHLQGLPAGTSVRWQNGSTAFTMPASPGNYSVEARYRGCLRTQAWAVTNRPVPVVHLGADTSICTGFTLPLRVQYPGATYLWSTGNTQNSIQATQPGRYWVRATLNGCNFSDTMQLTNKPCACNVSVPNAFSPNGDGINDVFAPIISCFPQQYRLVVFNRYGQQVFTTATYQQHWNGTHQGTPLPVGTYYYVLTYYNGLLLRNEQFKGSITLLR